MCTYWLTNVQMSTSNILASIHFAIDLKFFIWLFVRKAESEREETEYMNFLPCAPQKSATTRTRSGQDQEPATLSRSPIWVVVHLTWDTGIPNMNATTKPMPVPGCIIILKIQQNTWDTAKKKKKDVCIWKAKLKQERCLQLLAHYTQTKVKVKGKQLDGVNPGAFSGSVT